MLQPLFLESWDTPVKRDNEEYLRIKNVVNGDQGTEIPLFRS